MDLPSDESLTRKGLDLSGPDAPRKDRILLIACGAIAREVLAITLANGWDHMDLTCLPAILHNTPDRITDAVRTAVEKHRAQYDRIFVLYADCGTGGLLQSACKDMGVEMLQGPHCYSFFEENERFASHSESEFSSFYLTDFLVRQFDAFVWEPLGLDRHPQLMEMYFGHYTTLIYQAQTDDPALTAKAQEAAKRLGLAFERRFTGYGDLERELAAQA